MAKTIKETLLGTLVHGKEIMNQIEVLRDLSLDKIPLGAKTEKAINKIHYDRLELVVNEIIDTKKQAKTFRLVAKNGHLPPFEAGQYINLFTEIDGVRTSRPYSISSSPRQRAYYEITVARTQNGFVSDYFLDQVKIGDTFEANGPTGVFRYQPVFHSKKSLFLAGGSGITPFVSMLKEILSADLDREVTMLYGARNVEAALFHEELEAMAKSHSSFKYHLVLSEPPADWQGEKGFMGSDLIKRLVPDFAERTSYVCGPQIMNDFCMDELQILGLPIKKIRREMFGAAKSIETEPGWPSDINPKQNFNVKLGDQTFSALAGESLLTSIERAGIRINVCCRSGECSLCRVKLVTGKVFIAQGMMLRKADEKFGYIHTCKAYPISDVEIKI